VILHEFPGERRPDHRKGELVPKVDNSDAERDNSSPPDGVLEGNQAHLVNQQQNREITESNRELLSQSGK
jgi:hypothetical protein